MTDYVLFYNFVLDPTTLGLRQRVRRPSLGDSVNGDGVEQPLAQPVGMFIISTMYGSMYIYIDSEYI